MNIELQEIFTDGLRVHIPLILDPALSLVHTLKAPLVFNNQNHYINSVFKTATGLSHQRSRP
jgi:hypothetical protein